MPTIVAATRKAEHRVIRATEQAVRSADAAGIAEQIGEGAAGENRVASAANIRARCELLSRASWRARDGSRRTVKPTSSGLWSRHLHELNETGSAARQRALGPSAKRAQPPSGARALSARQPVPSVT